MASAIDASDGGLRGWWREWEAGLLVLVVAALCLPRLTQLNVRGEEPRRAQVAVEMVRSGDWIVPREQGLLYFSRPPLQNWAIGVLGLARGGVDCWAIRLPSVLAMVAVVLLIYAYGRLFLSRTAALTAAVAFASMAQVIELGRLGETDMMFAMFVTGSLLLWHYGRCRNWPAAVTWSAAYAMVALGTLTKGPQAPVYFAGTVGVYLLVTRRWRDAVSWGHLVGIGVFLLLWGVWQVPYYMAPGVGLDGTLRIYGRNVAVRFNETTWVDYVNHALTYPLEILFACLLPWSAMLVVYANRDFRRRIGDARDYVVFLLVALAVTFPTVWFVPTARSRYFMPMYPCFALLIGLAIERCWQAEPAAPWRRMWAWFLGGMAVVMFGAGAGILGLSVLTMERSPYAQPMLLAIGNAVAPYAEPLGLAIAYAVVAWLLTAVTVWAARGVSRLRRVIAVLAVAAFMGVVLVGVFGDSLARRSVDHAGQIAALRQKLPNNTRLFSLGPVYHLFAYHYGEPIEPLPVPKPGDFLPPECEYFCFHSSILKPEDVPFPFETVATISCDRFKKPTASDYVVVGRRKQDKEGR
jgi:4-amino-4-deoxy-L-arabinose transferase-like glycosyltransferase